MNGRQSQAMCEYCCMWVDFEIRNGGQMKRSSCDSDGRKLEDYIKLNSSV